MDLQGLIQNVFAKKCYVHQNEGNETWPDFQGCGYNPETNLLSTLGNYEFNGRAFFICKVHTRSGNCQEHNVLEIAQRLIDMSELMENDKYEVTTVWKKILC